MPLREIDAPTLKKLLDQGRATVIDVREPDEAARERIAGSRLNPLTRFNPAEVPPDNGKTVVLHCKAGRRSAEAAAQLMATGRAEVTHLKGGLDAWKAAGFPVEANLKAPIPIMRQVQLVVGITVLAGSFLAWLVSPWFLVLTGFFGAGLLIAGATGTCGLAAMLGLMPWNQGLKRETRN